MPTSSNTEQEVMGVCRLCGGEPICSGMGVLRYDAPVGDPNFGKVYRCPHNPVGADTERHSRLLRVSNLEAFVDKNFQNFAVDYPGLELPETSSLQAALTAAREFAKNPEGWFLLEGTFGCGKTHLAAAIGNLRLQLGDMVMFMTVPDVLDHLRSAFAPTAEVSYDETFDRIRNVPFLILDDLGAESSSPWAQEKLYQIFNHRYNRRLPTVVTTNVELERLDPRIRSRLSDESLTRRGKIIAPDYRSTRKPIDPLSGASLYNDMTFDKFDFERKLSAEEKVNLRKAFELASEYARQPQGWLIFTGANATGKTHLAAAIANQLRAQGKDVIFITVADLLDYLRVTFNPNASVSFDQRFQMIRNVPVLVLDDLTITGSVWAREKLFQLIDHRYVAQLPTVITTYKPIEELDNRIRTRILDTRRCLVFAIQCTDYPTRFRQRRQSQY
ncbi:MAG: ATP-binding protein [Anaerolineae bacterium]